MNGATIPAAIACIQDLFRGNSGGHDAAHSLSVYRNALRIADDEPVAHFHEKLLLLKDELNTEAARKLAEPRHAFLEQFLEEYEKESDQK